MISLQILNRLHENVNKALSQIVSVSFGLQMTHCEIMATFIITTESVKIGKNLRSDLAAANMISKYIQKFEY